MRYDNDPGCKVTTAMDKNELPVLCEKSFTLGMHSIFFPGTGNLSLFLDNQKTFFFESVHKRGKNWPSQRFELDCAVENFFSRRIQLYS